MLGALARSGVEISHLAEEYDLQPRQVELAILYDKLHPKKGRPTTSSNLDGYADIGNNDRHDIEELGEYTEP